MLLDKQNMFAENQTLAQVAGSTTVSTNAIDLLGGLTAINDTLGNAPLSDLGRSKMVDVLVQVTTTVTSGGSATIAFDLCTSTAADKSTGLVVHQSTPAIALATLVAGYQFRLEIPPGLPVTGQYLFVRFTVATATTTAGAFSAGIVADKQTAGYAI